MPDRPSSSAGADAAPDHAALDSREIAARLETLLSTISAGVFEVDAVGRIVYANPATLNLLGVTADQMIGRTADEMGIVRFDADGNRVDLSQSPIMRAGRDGRGSVKTVLRYTGIQGLDRWLESQATPLYSENGELKGTAISFVDVTERHRLEAELRHGQEQVHDVLRLMVVGVMLVDTAGRIEYANATALAGRRPEDVVGQLAADPAWQLMDELGQFVPYDALPVPTVLREQRPVHDVQLGSPMPDGSVRWLRVNATPRFSADGALRGAVVTVEDVTERRLLAEQLSQAQKIEGIGLLAGGVAHDFNNVLTTIFGNTDLALDALAPNSDLAAIVGEVRDAALRGAMLTRQLLTFARKQVVQARSVQLDQLVVGIERLLHRALGENIALRRVSHGQLWSVITDPGQMEQVVINMAINARDAMLDGGTLTIETSNVRIDAREALVHPGVSAGDFVMLAITDTGTGMRDEVKSHLFEPFFTTKPVGSGSGLGLAICHGVVKQARGFISVDSEPGRGTTFNVYLPRALSVERDADAPTQTLPDVPKPSAGTVLLVEDEESVRTLIARTLRSLGFVVHAAANGTDAMALVERVGATLDLLITDIVMPGIRGPEVARRVRQRFPRIPVLFITGYTEPSVVSDLPGDAETTLLLKPFAPAQMAERVQALLASRASKHSA